MVAPSFVIVTSPFGPCIYTQQYTLLTALMFASPFYPFLVGPDWYAQHQQHLKEETPSLLVYSSMVVHTFSGYDVAGSCLSLPFLIFEERTVFPALISHGSEKVKIEEGAHVVKRKY